MLGPLDSNQNSYRFHEGELQKILLQPGVANKKVAILSVAGAFRKGKSFLLNIFSRYLKATKTGAFPQGKQWLNEEEQVEGFPWRGGKERDTNGILIWNEPFYLKDKEGQEFVLFLMDTQGTFDHKTTVKGCATIFGLSTMTSAVQIYNLMGQIQENDLQHLQLFTEYGKLALQQSDDTPFQSLLFLVRDWNFDDDFGFSAGQEYIDDVLKASNDQHEELRSVRQQISSCFSKISCFLLPNPGNSVARCAGRDGKLPVMDRQFREQVCELTESLFDLKRISPKRIAGAEITCSELFEYFKGYMKVFSSEDTPSPTSLLVATAEANHAAAVDKSFRFYESAMAEVCTNNTVVSNLPQLHANAEAAAMQNFTSMKKIGGPTYTQRYTNDLKQQINGLYMKKQDENRRNQQIKDREQEILRQKREQEEKARAAERARQIAEQNARAAREAAQRVEKQRQEENRRRQEAERQRQIAEQQAREEREKAERAERERQEENRRREAAEERARDARRSRSSGLEEMLMMQMMQQMNMRQQPTYYQQPISPYYQECSSPSQSFSQRSDADEERRLARNARARERYAERRDAERAQAEIAEQRRLERNAKARERYHAKKNMRDD